jgi:hypothetical protein
LETPRTKRKSEKKEWRTKEEDGRMGKLRKKSRQKLETESAGFVSCKPHARKWRDWN